MMKKLFSLLLVSVFLLGGVLGCSVSTPLPENGIVINEVVASNKLSLTHEVYGSPDWIELYNGSAEDVDLSGYYLTDNVENPDKLSPLPRQVLKAGEYLLLYANGESGENCLSFSLSRKGETLTLVNPRKEAVSSLTVPALEKDVSYARRPDGTYGYCQLPTPGEANSGEILTEAPTASLLVKEGDEEYAGDSYEVILFNELLSRGELVYCEDCGRYVDCIELFNPGLVTTSLKGYTLSDDPEDSKKHNMPKVELDGLHYLLLYGCDAGCACSNGHTCMDFGLSRYGETLYLFDPLGNLLDTVELPELEKGTTYARRSDGSWGVSVKPTLGSANVEEDIGAAPVVSSDTEPVQGDTRLYISEALAKNVDSVIDEDGDRSDFCEIYNKSNEAVSLKGWYLSDNPNKLSKWALPDVILQPGEYLLIFLSGKNKSTGELHASFSLSAGETLTLYDSATGVYDALTIPETREGVSVGKDETGATIYFGMPTPGYANGHGFPLQGEKSEE